MNFIVLSDGSPTTMYFNTMGDGNSGTWNSDNIHYGENHDPVNDNCELINPNQWDPDEYLYVWIGFSQNPIGVWAITPNGATSYHSVP